jgi:outer membrane murein-binding lipoprotein Lpp
MLCRLTRSVNAKESLIRTLKAKNQQLEDSLEQMTTSLGPAATTAATSDYGNIPLPELKSK